jgi:ABC-type lipoprotein release transport system permease subunit
MTSKKIMAQTYQKIFQHMRKGSISVQERKWILENIQALQRPKDSQTYHEVFYRIESSKLWVLEDEEIQEDPGTHLGYLQSFVFNESGKIVEQRRYSESEEQKIQELERSPAPSPALKERYQNLLTQMNTAFQEYQLDRLLDFFDENVEVYQITSENEKIPAQEHLSPQDPFEMSQSEGFRYFPVLIGTEIKRNRLVFLRVPGDFTLLGGYYNRQEKEIRTISKKFTAVGTFKTGMHEYDSKVLYCPIQGAQVLQIPPEILKEYQEALEADPLHFEFPPEVRFNRITNFSIALKKPDQLESLKENINDKFGAYGKAETWMDRRRMLLDAVNLEKSIMNFILYFIILLAAVSIIFVLWLMVAEKTKDIGVLRSMGTSSLDILAIFLVNGMVIAVLGTLFGAFLGLTVATHVNELENFLYRTTGLEVFPRDVYYLDHIPVHIDPSEISWVIGWTIFASLLLSLIPAYFASKADPVKCIYHQ